MRRSFGISALSGSAAILSILCPAGMAHAQSASVPAVAPDPASKGPEEIVVIATKIGPNTEKTPIAVTSITPAQLASNHIISVADIAVRTPSLNYTTASGFALAYIRGLGSNFSLAGLESSVATYVDGVYLQRQAGAVVDLVDVKSVQVLKGPQGTLYGRNATGGAILVETADPTDKFGGSLTGEYGRFNQTRIEGVLNMPLTDNLAVRIAGQYKSIGNYFDDVYNGGGRGHGRSYYVRGKIKWEPAPGFSIVYGLEYYHRRSTGYSIRETLPSPYCLACVVYGIDPPEGKGYYFVGGTSSAFNQSRFVAQTLKLDYRSGPLQITSITGLRNQNVPYINDQDSLGPDFFHTFVREKGPTLYNDNYARLKVGSRLNLFAGLSYERERDTQDAYFIGDAFQGLVPHNRNKVRIDSISLYGEATYDFGSGFKLTGGARYNHDKKAVSVTNNGDAGLVLGVPSTADVAAKFSNITPRAVLSYEHGDGYYYASYNRGARSGGFGSPVLAPASSVKPETLDNFEIGAKNRFFDRRLQTTLAAFYGIYRSIQIQVVDAQSGTVLLQNAARGRVAGAEFDAQFAMTPALTIAGGVTYLDNKFSKFPNAAVFGPGFDANGAALPGLVNGVEDLSHTLLPRSPHFSGYGSADYTLDLPGGWSAKLSGIAHFTTSFLFSPGAGGPLLRDRQSGYTTVDATLTFLTPSKSTEIGAYVQNMFETHYAIQALTQAYGAFLSPGMPRTFGVRASQKF